jgi:hypothetical protein
MNANDTVAAVRDSLTTAMDSLSGLHMDTPADAIARKGRTRRRWRMLTGVTGAVAVVAGAALAMTALAPPSHTASQSRQPASHPRTAELAAWTVIKQANGDIKVTISQLSDPSGLQSTLRSDGVPASVTFLTQADQSCQLYPMTQALFKNVYQGQTAAGSGDTVLIIDPSAIPSGAGVQIGTATGQQAGNHRRPLASGNQTIIQPVHRAAAGAANTALRVGLVYASQQCTGS